MAKFIFRNATVEVNTVDLSNHVDQVVVDEKWDVKEVTGLGSQFKEKKLGLADATIKIDFWQDFAAGTVDDTLAPLAGSNDAFPLTVTDLDSGKTWTMNALLPEYMPVNAKVGDPSSMSITFENGDQSGIVAA